jgi:hypothetical protein
VRGSGKRRLGVVALVLVALVVPAATIVAAQPPPSEQDPAEVRRLADEILARDEFQPPEPTLLERIGDWLGDLFPGDSNSGDGGSEGSGSGGAGAAGGGGSGVLTTILLVLAVVGVGYVVFVLVGQPRRRRPERDDDPALEIEPHRSAGEWLAAAEQAEAEGRWKDGLRARFRALVEELLDARIVPEVAGRTSGELRGDVQANLPAAGPAFALAVDLFDRAWYGDLPTGPEEALQFSAAATAVVAEVPRRPAPAPEPVEVEA